MHGICDISCAPLRREPTGKSEMTSMLLFGEHFSILEPGDDWMLIRCAFDGYEGWLSSKQCRHINASHSIEEQRLVVTKGLLQTVSGSKRRLLLPAGSTLPHFDEKTFRINEEIYTTAGEFQYSAGGGKKEIISDAHKFLEAPYLWGGRSPLGIDCSGFTQVVFKMNGIPLKRDASQQVGQGEAVTFLGESRPGDLAFFDNEEGIITHVGIIMENNEIIHAAGKVRIDSIDQQGIFNRESGKHSHRLRTIRRIA